METNSNIELGDIMPSRDIYANLTGDFGDVDTMERFRNRSTPQGSNNLLGSILGGYAPLEKQLQDIAGQGLTGNPLRDTLLANFNKQRGRQYRKNRESISNNINPNLRGTGVTANAFNELAEADQNANSQFMTNLGEQDMAYNQFIQNQKMGALGSLIGIQGQKGQFSFGDRSYGLDLQRFQSDDKYRNEMMRLQKEQGWGKVLGDLLGTGLKIAFPGTP